jgi:hypothetical protein
MDCEEMHQIPRLALATLVLALLATSMPAYEGPAPVPEVDAIRAAQIAGREIARTQTSSDRYIDRLVLITGEQGNGREARCWVVSVAEPAKGYRFLLVEMDGRIRKASSSEVERAFGSNRN